MPFTQKHEEGLLFVSAVGEVTANELLQLHAELAGETSRYEACVIDFTGGDVSGLVGPMVRDLAGLPPKFKRLAIVANPGLAYALARMYQESASYGRAIGAFRTLDTARLWLVNRAERKDPLS